MILYLTKINENISEDILDNRMSLLCSKRLEQALACKQQKDRIRSVFAGLLLQKGIEEWLFQKGEILSKDANGRVLLEIEQSKDGKPFLKDYPMLHYSISHSGDYVGCAFHDLPIGFDLQQKRECSFERLIYKFHPKEIMQWNCMPPSEREDYFWRLWTTKEAYGKCTGKGLAEGFSSFFADITNGEIYNSRGECVAYSRMIENLHENYYFSIVTKTRDIQPKIIKNNP